jgi:Bacterial pre-peptidase C-terminal domain
MSFNGNSLLNSTNLAITSSNQVVTDGVSSANLVDTFRFTTTAARSSVNLRLTGLSGDANLGLIRDLNANNIVDANEVLASSLNTGTLAELINLSDLAPATYFVQISLGGE